MLKKIYIYYVIPNINSDFVSEKIETFDYIEIPQTDEIIYLSDVVTIEPTIWKGSLDGYYTINVKVSHYGEFFGTVGENDDFLSDGVLYRYEKDEVFLPETIDLTQVQKYEFYILENNEKIVIDTKENIAKINEFLGDTELNTYKTNEWTACESDATIRIFLEPEESLDFEIYNDSDNYLIFSRYYNDTGQTINYDDKNYDDLFELLHNIENETLLPAVDSIE